MNPFPTKPTTSDRPADDKLRVLVVDDEPPALKRILMELEAIPNIDIVGSARDGDSAIEEAFRLLPDLIILDVEMPGPDGLEVASRLARENGPEIIILSAFDRYATVAFEVEALDYLLKPLRRDRLRQAIDRARRRRSERAAHVAIAIEEGKVDPRAVLHVPDHRRGGRDVLLSTIIWIEAAQDYVLIHTGTRTHILRATMTELAKELPSTILRVHRSTFVALAQVRHWGVQTKGLHRLILSDGAEITVGPSYLPDVKVALRSLEP